MKLIDALKMAWGECPVHGTKPDYTCDDCMLPWNHYDPRSGFDSANTAETVYGDHQVSQA